MEDIAALKEQIKDKIETTHKFIFAAGQMYELMNDIYVRVEDHQIESYLAAESIKATNGEDIFKRNEKAEFVDHLKSKSFIRWDELKKHLNPHLIPFANEVLDISTFQPYDFTQDYYFFFKIPHNLDKEKLQEAIEKDYGPAPVLQLLAPKIYAFFKDIVGEENVILQLAKIGYCFYPANPFKLMFMELGPKDAGKTTFIKLLTYVLGEQNIAVVSLQDLADYRFARANLFGKLANIYDDLPTSIIKNTGVIKMLSGESIIDAPIKLKQEVMSFVNTSKSIFATNKLPFVSDTSDEAFFSRWIITHYPNSFARNDGFFKSLISDEHEIEGLIVASLLALRDLLAGRFAFQDKTKEYMELWQRQNNNIYAFVQDSVKAGTLALGKEYTIEKDMLYQYYLDYCDDQSEDAKSKTKFTQELERLFGISTTKLQKDGKQIQAYRGIGIEIAQKPLENEENQENEANMPQKEIVQQNAKESEKQANVIYDNPQKPIICPRCGKSTSKLYEYGGEWVCVDCLNELQHLHDDEYEY